MSVYQEDWLTNWKPRRATQIALQPSNFDGMYADDPYAYTDEVSDFTTLLDLQDDGGECAYSDTFIEDVVAMKVLPQPQVNLFWRLMKEFNLTVTSSWQGRLAMYLRYNTTVLKKVLGESFEREKIVTEQEAEIPSRSETGEKEESMGQIVQAKTSEPLFESQGRQYVKKEQDMMPWNDVVLEDYFSYLRERTIYHSISEVGYEDPLVLAKWLPQTWDVAETLARELPIAMSYYVPGDGLGVFSYKLRKRGMAVYSSEPSQVGEIAISLGLIDEKAEYDEVLDDGTTVLLLANIPPHVKIGWRGPIVLWQQEPDREIGEEVQGTAGRLRIRGLTLNFRTTMGEPSRFVIERIKQWLLMRMKDKLLDKDNIFVEDRSMLYMARQMDFRILSRREYRKLEEPDKILVIGKDRGQYDIHRLQDRYGPNARWRFMCNLKDTVYVAGRRQLVKRYGKLLDWTDNSLEEVQVLSRSNNDGYEVVSEGPFGYYMDRIRPHTGRIKSYVDGELCEFEVIQPVEKRLEGYHHRLKIVSRVGARVLHAVYKERDKVQANKYGLTAPESIHDERNNSK